MNDDYPLQNLTTADLVYYLELHGWRDTGETTASGTYWDLVTAHGYWDVLVPNETTDDAPSLITFAVYRIAEAEHHSVEYVADTIAAANPRYHLARITTPARRVGTAPAPQWTPPAYPAAVQAVVIRMAGDITFSRLRGYLRRAGWRHHNTIQDVQVWSHGDTVSPGSRNCLWLPAGATTDPAPLIVRTIYRLAAWEDRPVREVLRQLLQQPPDIVLTANPDQAAIPPDVAEAAQPALREPPETGLRRWHPHTEQLDTTSAAAA